MIVGTDHAKADPGIVDKDIDRGDQIEHGLQARPCIIRSQVDSKCLGLPTRQLDVALQNGRRAAPSRGDRITLTGLPP